MQQLLSAFASLLRMKKLDDRLWIMLNFTAFTSHFTGPQITSGQPLTLSVAQGLAYSPNSYVLANLLTLTNKQINRSRLVNILLYVPLGIFSIVLIAFMNEAHR